MIKRKKDGGFGLNDPKQMDRVVVVKMARRIWKGKSMWARWMQQRYIAQVLIDIQPRSKDSSHWSHILRPSRYLLCGSEDEISVPTTHLFYQVWNELMRCASYTLWNIYTRYHGKSRRCADLGLHRRDSQVQAINVLLEAPLERFGSIYLAFVTRI